MPIVPVLGHGVGWDVGFVLCGLGVGGVCEVLEVVGVVCLVVCVLAFIVVTYKHVETTLFRLNSLVPSVRY